MGVCVYLGGGNPVPGARCAAGSCPRWVEVEMRGEAVASMQHPTTTPGCSCGHTGTHARMCGVWCMCRVLGGNSHGGMRRGGVGGESALRAFPCRCQTRPRAPWCQTLHPKQTPRTFPGCPPPLPWTRAVWGAPSWHLVLRKCEYWTSSAASMRRPSGLLGFKPTLYVLNIPGSRLTGWSTPQRKPPRAKRMGRVNTTRVV